MVRDKVSSVKKYGLLFRLGFLLLSVYILFQIVDYKLVFQYIRDIPIRIVCFLVAISLFRIWLTGVRWKILNPDVSGQLSNWQYFRLVMIAKPFNIIMPGALGGDFARTAFTIKTVKTNRVDNVIAILVDRFVGLLSITILGATALLFTSDLKEIRPFYTSFALLASFFFVSIIIGGNPWALNHFSIICSKLGSLGQKILYILECWKDALHFFRKKIHLLFLALLLCLPIHGLSFFITFILAKSLGIEVSLFDVSVVLSLVWVITAVPITISGAGIRELSMVYFFSFFGVQSESAAAISIYLYIISISLGLIGIVFIFFPDNPYKNKDKL